MNVPTHGAEWALRRLTTRAADYRATARAPIEIRRYSSDRLSWRDANAMVDMVAVAEAFCVDRLASVGVVTNVDTWKKREAAWLGLGVDLVATCPVWSALMGFVQARNAIQHGLGRLTRQQLGKFKQQNLASLAAAGIRLNGDALLFDFDDVEDCARVCADFVRWLDAAAPVPV